MKTKTKDMKERTKELGKLMRKGQLAAHEPIPFIGSSHYSDAMRVSPMLGVHKGSKPMDSLLVSDKIRMVADKSMSKRDY